MPPNVEDLYKLSPIQQGLLFHSLYNPNSAIYFEQFSWPISGDFDPTAFEAAWQQALDRHPILRTAFYWEDLDEPLQAVYRRVTLPLRQHDWRDLSADEQSVRLEAYLADDRRGGFDLSEAPLLRLTLIRMDANDYYFICSYHHLLLDGWSTQLLLKDVITLYTALRQGTSASLEKRRPYRDYISWLRQQDMLSAEAFWRRTLEDFSAPTPLGIDRLLRSADGATEYDEQRDHFSMDFTAALQAFARHHRLTVSTLMQGAWALLLSCYSGEETVVFGVTVSGRPPSLAGSESMIGVFINTLPMRVRVPPQAALLPWLKQLQEQQGELLEYQYTPLVEILGWSDVPRGLPLFESILVFENFPLQSIERSSDVRIWQRTNYPLTLLAEMRPHLILRLAYERQRFDVGAIALLLEHLRTILEQIVGQPDQRLVDLPILTDAQRHQLLVEWNATEVAYPPLCLDQLIEAQVAQTPDAVALVFEEQQLSYRGLNGWANQLAHQLRRLGVGPEVLVGLCLERSLELVIGLLGVLKAGGAYVPLDPSYPQERLAFMLEDSQLQVLLTATTDDRPPTTEDRGLKIEDSGADAPEMLSSILHPPSSSCAVVDLVADWPIIAQQPLINPASRVTPANLAYVIYTSGSTGRPKGAMNTHRAIVNRLCWMQDAFALTSADAVLQKTPASFDVSVWEFFWPLLTGARLVLARPNGHQDPAYLVDLVAAQQITTLHFVPSMLRLFLEMPDLTPCRSLRRVICSGEALPYELQERAFARLDAALHNLYGPTEAAVDVSAWACARASARQLVPIGRPIANTQLYVLDRTGQPVPVGVPGELYIGGVQLARGYLQRPELTAERFVPNPFRKDEGGRMKDESDPSFIPHPSSFILYRTGDLVRYLADGNIEFLGRMDQQVKLRGFRIELGEVEATLMQHPAVDACAVVVWEDGPGDQRLVAYVVPKLEDGGWKIEDRHTGADEKPSSILHPPSSILQELRAFLQSRLPEYMVPTVFVPLAALPLTPNGKLDRRALPAPSEERPELEQGFVAPRTPIEELLAGIWAEVLGLRQVGVHDNFFALGGHSLLATQVITRLHDAFQSDLPVRSLFEAPTVAGLTRRIEAAQQAGAPPPPPIRPVVQRVRLPLSFVQRQLWFLDQLHPGSVTYNIPIAARLGGQLDCAALERSLNAIVGRHEALRTTFPTVDGLPSQRIASRLHVPLVAIDVTSLGSKDRAAALRTQLHAAARQPFDLAHGPLLRIYLLRLEADEHVLLLATHHIVFDGWSSGVLLRELAALYGAFTGNKPSPLPELAIQYADYALWQRDWLQGEALEAQLDYWKRQLAGLTVLELPTDHPRPAQPSQHGATLAFQLAPELTSALQALTRTSESTLFMLLLAAFQCLLARYTGLEDIAVGTPIAGRTRAETEPLLGCFVNTQVLRTRLGGNPSFRGLVGQVREVCLGAYSHQELPFEVLVEALQPARDLSRTPLFHVLFSLQNTPLPPLVLPGVRLEPLELANETAKFDLSLGLQESAGGLRGELEYNIELFEAETIARMAAHYQLLLEQIVTNPDLRLGELSLLTEAERRQVLVEWNSTTISYPPGQCIHLLFEAQAARTPHAPALIFNQQNLSYCELNQRANQVAHHLRTLGVGPDVCVGICLERSLEMVVGLLGILKAGGAYVPLDPAHPQERLAFILEDAQVAVLLTQEQLLPALPAQGVHVVCMDRDRELIGVAETDNPITTTQAQNLAYVIYTSGSTGRPKGVLISHQALVDHSYAVVKRCDMQATDRLLQFASLNSDIAVEDLFPTWLSGATVVLWPDPGVADFETFSAFAEKERLTVLNLPTAYWHEWVSYLTITRTPVAATLRLVIVGGEKALPERLAAWRKLVSDRVRWSNAYGPTEATISTTIYEPDLAQADSSDLRSIPIGRPIANTQIYLLDQYLKPVPIGMPGEIHIGGLRLARGYLGRPDLTAERFIPNPFANEDGGWRMEDGRSRSSILHPPSSRLYRTGDLARYLPDGNIEFLGRIDHQVKVRGFRIELAEIEMALGQHPAVREAVVVAREDTPGDRRLVAYLVPTNDQRPTTNEESDPSFVVRRSSFVSELRSFLKERLPDYMVPAIFMLLDVLPLTPNGKVDLRALPAPDSNRPALLEDAFVAPRTQAEITLAAIWSKVLRLEQIGVHDNFFALGGDSILSIQIIARANQAGLHLTPRDLFQHQTIAALAAAADTSPPPTAEQELVTGPVPLTPIQHWFFAQDLPEPHHFNQDVLLAVRLRLDPALIDQALQHLLAHHDALRLRFQRTESGWRQFNAGVAAQPVVVCVDLSSVLAAEREAALTAAATQQQASLNLAEGPLMRVVLIDMGADQPGRFLWIIHHLAVDGVSWRVLLEDLQTVYEQLSRGEAAALPPKTSSFKRWAERLAAYARSDDLQPELLHWLAALRNNVARLPMDDPHAANTVASAQTLTMSLDAELTRTLLREVPQAYRTQINDVLLTALAQTLGAWTGTRAVLVDLEGHGREDLFDDIDLSRAVGWFTAIFPVCLDLTQVAGPGESLKVIKEQLRQIPQHGIGYGLLRYLSGDMGIAAQLQQQPRSQVTFNYLGQIDQVLPTTGLFGAANETSGPTQSTLGKRSHLLDVAGIVAGGQLHMTWTYSAAVYRRATIERLAQEFMAALQALIDHCLSPEAGGYTPSDFPLARLDQPALDRLAGRNRQVEDIYPLAPLQQGMLFHTLHDNKPGMYVEQLSFPIYGGLDVAAFTRAWQQAVDRYAVFRTAFFWEGLKAPVQVVYRHVSLQWTVEDWRGLAPGEQETHLNVFLASDRQRGFTLSQAPLMRLSLLRVAEDSYEFVWSSHHILMDGWSLPLVLHEIFARYASLANGRELQLAPLRPYREYIAWLQRQDLKLAESFWRQTLSGFRLPTSLGIDRTRDTDGRLAGAAEQSIQLPEATTAALQAMGRQHGLTMNTLVQGAWALLLSHYSGETDVVFGATVSGRSPELPGVETMVGLFINTLPVRVRTDLGESLLRWLQRLQAQLAELRQYEYSPLVDIQGWSEVPRGQPLFESIVVFENYPVDTAVPTHDAPAQLSSGKVRIAERTNYPLTVIASPDQRLTVRIIYDSGRFDAAAIERLLGHIQMLLEGMAAQPRRRLSDLPLLTDIEQRQLAGWNATAAAYPDDRCVHQLIEAQVAQRPDAVAAVFDDTQLTYGELNRRANQLAHYLAALGVGPDVCVGIYLERSLEMAVAVQGVLKAGGACVPLDPAYPPERLAFMLAEAGVAVLLTTNDQRPTTNDQRPTTEDRGLKIEDSGTDAREMLSSILYPPSSSWTVVCLDTDWAAIGSSSVENLATAVHADSLLYVIYTSGSTGRPKGVAMTHRPLVNLVAWQRRSWPLPEGVRTLQFAPLSFDVAFQEMFATWCAGGTLIMLPETTHRDPAALRQLLDDAAVERLFLPFVALQQLAAVSGEDGPAPADLREIITAGEQLQITQPIARLASKLPACVLHNQYGPSETHVVTAYPLAGAPAEWPVLPPIGQPIANTQIYLLDSSLRPVPVGVAGELYIGGANLARGYLGRPDLTAERFVPNPFADQRPTTTDQRPTSGDGKEASRQADKETGESPISNLQSPDSFVTQHSTLKTQNFRLYRTGDLARYLPDGNIEFLGRIDHQVKVRGFRIEPGEIEALLGQHPAVREAVVAAREDTPGHRRLVAYVVPTNDQRPTTNDQRQGDQETRGQGDKETEQSAIYNLQSAIPETPSSILHPPSSIFSELRAFLQQRLPEYMLPSAFVFLDALPLTPSGKLDRRALLAPDRDRPALDVPYVAPRTPLEEQLAAIWSEVLGVERVGVYDNFFVLGGHSLLATQVVSRVREEFQVELPLRTLFAEPTLATLADAIIQQTVEQTDSELLAQLMAELEGSAIDTP